MLRGAPNNPAYRRDEVPTAVSRLAISDLQYADFSGAGTFFTAQTDWSQGIKSDRKWADDGKYYYSTNIDAYSEPGAFKLNRAIETDNDFAENLVCGLEGLTNGGVNKYAGTVGGVSAPPKFYKYAPSSWSEIGSSNSWNNASDINFAIEAAQGTFVLVGLVNAAGTNKCLYWYNGSIWADLTGAANTAAGTTFDHAFCAVSVGLRIYVVVGNANSASAGMSLIYSDDDGNTFTQLVDNNDYYKGRALDMAYYGGELYLYTLLPNSEALVSVINTTTGDHTDLARFPDATFDRYIGFNQRLLHVLNNKLVITVPNDSVYEYDGSDITRIFKRDDKKTAIGVEADAYLGRGGLFIKDSIEWGNLIYDGTSFSNGRKDGSDTTSANIYLVPFLAELSPATNLRYYYSTTDSSILVKEDSNNYKGTLAKNFIVFSEMSPVVSIDKLLTSITLIFDPLITGYELAVEYSIDGGTTWTALPTITSTTEGTTATKRDFAIPGTVIYSKIFVRVKMASSVDSTPTIRDVIVGYKPIPNYKSRWQLRMEMSDGVRLLNEQKEQRTGADLVTALWNEKATKQTVNFEDVDYIECTMQTAMTATQTSASVDKTINFPRQGRIRAVSGGVAEEMTYTSALTNKLLGISRGQRGTKAKAYLSGQVLKNDYSVYIERLQSEINWTDQNKNEHIAVAVLLES